MKKRTKFVLIVFGLLTFVIFTVIINLIPGKPRNYAEELYKDTFRSKIESIDYMHGNILTIYDSSNDTTITYYFTLNPLKSKIPSYSGVLSNSVEPGDSIIKSKNKDYFDVIKQASGRTLRFYFTMPS